MVDAALVERTSGSLEPQTPQQHSCGYVVMAYVVMAYGRPSTSRADVWLATTTDPTPT